MERLTTYHCGVAVIKNKELLSEAMAKLAAYEDTGLAPAEIMDGKLLTGWIPVEERLPDRNGEYLVCLKEGMVETEPFANGEWFYYSENQIVAWMPLPEPYQQAN